MDESQLYSDTIVTYASNHIGKIPTISVAGF